MKVVVRQAVFSFFFSSFVVVTFFSFFFFAEAYYLANFQGLERFQYKQFLALPRTERELKRVVEESRRRDEKARIRAVSRNTHSWTSFFWCARSSEEGSRYSVNVFVNELRSSVFGEGEDALLRFKVSENGRYVISDAGTLTRDLLEFLSKRGLTVKAVPWFIDQTVGGAVSSCSHGSSLKYSSMSNQVVAFRAMLSNATIVSIKKDEDKDAFDAFLCSIG